MALGLFTLQIESAVNQSLSKSKVSAVVSRQVIQDVRAAAVTFNLLAYTLMSLFVVYFAFFQSKI
ncbi:truncated ORF4 [Alpaca respiratory coronavirus]|uniref:Truncated ORF4 n=1 Tax=Alpaca respiratory coronavirus TaxID=1176035 RepID=I1VWF6_CVH22|nr:truncated ORF4 [Alpaca respiratory coronavirus]